jgi:hypothetical protein
MRLRKYPIVAVTSITDPALNTVPAADYLIIARTGSLRHLGYWPVPQNTAGLMAEWTVVYTAGRFATLVDVTDDLKLACVLLVSHRLIHVTPGVASKTAGELSVSYRDPESGDRSGLPADVQGLVWPYVSRAA